MTAMTITPDLATTEAGLDRAAPSAVLDRASLVIDAFDGPGQLTLADIVRRTGLPRSSAHRILERLVALRWLRRHGRAYELGIRLMELGSIAVHQDRLHRAAVPYLLDLHRATGLVVHLALLDRADVVYLENIGGPLAASIPTRVGGRFPAHCTAVGKAILAFTRPCGTPTGPLERKTRYSIADATRLDTELARIRQRGASFEREESLPGIGCVAAPIGEIGDAVAAVSVCGPAEKMTFDHRLIAPVQMTSLAIWRDLDHAAARVTPTLQRHRGLRLAPATPYGAPDRPTR